MRLGAKRTKCWGRQGEGRAILDELAHPLVTQVDTMDGAADKAAELANG